MDMDTTADILSDSCTCLAEAKPCDLTHAIICEATQTGKCLDEIKACNANIHTYTSHFMETQQKDNETLDTYIHHFKTAAKQCAFNIETVVIYILLKGL